MSTRLTTLFIYILMVSLFSCGGGGGGGGGGTGGGASAPPPVSQAQTDPLYAYQWHLKNTAQNSFATNAGLSGVDINVEDVISAGIKGNGVTIAISDSGIETIHEDLSDNYKTGISKNFLLASPYSGDPVANTTIQADHHGTSVTGIIAAIGWNNKGGRGVAPLAKFGGFNLVATGVSQSLDKKLYQMTGSFDIFNYSYGGSPCLYRAFGSSAERTSIINSYKTGVTTARSGKGFIYVKAAGNEYLSDIQTDCGYMGTWESSYLGNAVFMEDNNYPYTILVGAINASGGKSSYSNPGSNLWVAGPGGEFGTTDPAIITTDFSGCNKGSSNASSTANSFEKGESSLNSNCNYTSTMNGTSSAAPIVSGVVALILEANPNLTWRDVKHILASTASTYTATGSYPHPLGYNLTGHTYQQKWVQNAAGYWFHNYHGFGLVNTSSAVNLAKNYTVNLGTFKETVNVNDNSWLYTSGNINLAIPNNSAAGVTSSINVKHNFIIEAIQIKTSITHNYIDNIGIELTSPNGTKSIITNINSGVLDINLSDAVFLTNAFYGEESKGNWTIKVIDGANINPDGTSGSAGTLTNWKINIFGHSPVSPVDTTPPNPVASVTHASYYSSLTSSPLISFPASSSGDVLRYEISLGTAAGLSNTVDWFSIGGSTAYTFTSLSLQEGLKYYVNVRAVDTSENVSTIRSSLGWTVDTQVSAVVINSGNSTTSMFDGSNVLTGTCEANSTLTVTPSSGLTVNSSSCNSSGQLSISLSFGATIAQYTLTVHQTDQANNVSSNTTLTIYYIPRDREFLSLGDFHGCLVDKNGAAKCWGSNSTGQLGNGTTTNNNNLVSVTGLTSGVKSVASGTGHSCAVTTSGGVKCWGDNTYGQIGDGSNVQRNTPVDVSGLTTGVLNVVVGSIHSCALLSTGVVKCWGYNGYGSLGNNSTVDSNSPVTVSGLSSVKYIFSNRGAHTCALLTSGGAKCWGANSYGQIGDGSNADRLVPVDVSGHSTGIDYLYTSGFATCSRSTAGNFKCWGYNSYGQLGDQTKINKNLPVDVTITSNIKELSLGEWGTCAFLQDSTSKCWGYNAYNQYSSSYTVIETPTTYPVNTHVIIRSGASFACSLNSLGNINCRGMRSFGQTGEGTTAYSISNSSAEKYIVINSTGLAAQISIGDEHMCFVTTAKDVFCSGGNDNGELGDLYSLLGNIIGTSTPKEIGSLSGTAEKVSVGINHTCILNVTGGVQCWGKNNYGQLGNGTNASSNSPVNVSGLSSGVIDITSGLYHTCALLNSGGVRCWGRNENGELGNSTLISSSTPVTVTSMSSVTQIQAGRFHTCAIKSDRVWCWGLNNYGQLGDGTTTTRSTAVNPNTSSNVTLLSAGGWHSCAYTTTNAVRCWGSNVNCELGTNNNACPNSYTPVDVYGITTGVTQLSAGNSHSCALMADGSVRCWGSNLYGQLGSQTTGNNYYTYTSFSSSNVPYLNITDLFIGGNSSCATTSGNDAYCWGSNTYGQRGDSRAESQTNNTSAINASIF